MPNYTFINTETDEEYVENMSNVERELYLENNPKIRQVIIPISIGDPVRLGITKPPADFQKNILGRIRDAVPGNNIDQQSKFGIPKEI